jgi:hypothetical protein
VSRALADIRKHANYHRSKDDKERLSALVKKSTGALEEESANRRRRKFGHFSVTLITKGNTKRKKVSSAGPSEEEDEEEEKEVSANFAFWKFVFIKSNTLHLLRCPISHGEIRTKPVLIDWAMSLTTRAWLMRVMTRTMT